MHQGQKAEAFQPFGASQTNPTDRPGPASPQNPSSPKSGGVAQPASFAKKSTTHKQKAAALSPTHPATLLLEKKRKGPNTTSTPPACVPPSNASSHEATAAGLSSATPSSVSTSAGGGAAYRSRQYADGTTPPETGASALPPIHRDAMALVPLSSNQVVPNSNAVARLPELGNTKRGAALTARPVIAGRREPLHKSNTAQEWIQALGKRHGLSELAIGIDNDDDGEDSNGDEDGAMPDPTAPLPTDPTAANTALVPRETPRAPAVGRDTFSSLEDAKLRRQIFGLCQQLTQRQQRALVAAEMSQSGRHHHHSVTGAPPVVEVIVKERGDVVWRSQPVETSFGATNTTTGTAAASLTVASSQNGGELAAMLESDIDAIVDEDLAQVRKRAKRAFNKTVATFKKRIDEQAKEIKELRAERDESAPGGKRYEAMQNQLEGYRRQTNQMGDKIKSLVKLLEKAGQVIKEHEQQKESEQKAMLGGAKSLGKGGSPSASSSGQQQQQQRLDWEPIAVLLPDLVYDGNRQDQHVLRDVTELLERIVARAREIEENNEMLQDKCADRDHQLEVLTHDRDALVVKLRLSEASGVSLREDIKVLHDDIAGLKEKMEAQRRSHEAERDRLIYQAMEIEKSIRKAVEVKPYFVGMGKGLSVPCYLRYEGRVKNLDLPKKEVEDIINMIWGRRDQGHALRRANRAVHEYTTRVLGAAAFSLPDSGLGTSAMGAEKMPSGDQLEELIDYDNVRFVKKLSHEFPVHLCLFLLDRFSKDEDEGGKKGGKGTGKKSAHPAITAKDLAVRGFSLPPEVAEISYSLIEGCEKYKYDADIELFRRIVKEEISELVYFDQMVMLTKLKASLLHAGKTINGLNGSASFNVIMQTLEKFFLVKSEESMEQLRRALVVEVPDGTAMDEAKISTFPLSITKLFASNEHGNQGSFMEAVRDQHLEDACFYNAEVQTVISTCGGGKGKASLAEVRTALQKLDPMKPVEDINRFLLKAMSYYSAKTEGGSGAGADDKDEDDEADDTVGGAFDGTIHLNTEVDCERLAQSSRKVFTKRYGPKEVDDAQLVMEENDEEERHGESNTAAATEPTAVPKGARRRSSTTSSRRRSSSAAKQQPKVDAEGAANEFSADLTVTTPSPKSSHHSKPSSRPISQPASSATPATSVGEDDSEHSHRRSSTRQDTTQTPSRETTPREGAVHSSRTLGADHTSGGGSTSKKKSNASTKKGAGGRRASHIGKR